MGNDSAFQSFVNTELPKRVSCKIPQLGDLGKNLQPVSTGVGLEVRFREERLEVPRIKTITTVGILKEQVGTIRWYPRENIKLIGVRAWCGSPSEGKDIRYLLKVSGEAAFEGVIPEGDIEAEAKTIEVVVQDNQYLTLDISACGDILNGSDLVVNFKYLGV